MVASLIGVFAWLSTIGFIAASSRMCFTDVMALRNNSYIRLS